jgi:hypothetical protein
MSDVAITKRQQCWLDHVRTVGTSLNSPKRPRSPASHVRHLGDELRHHFDETRRSSCSGGGDLAGSHGFRWVMLRLHVALTACLEFVRIPSQFDRYQLKPRQVS